MPQLTGNLKQAQVIDGINGISVLQDLAQEAKRIDDDSTINEVDKFHELYKAIQDKEFSLILMD
jgi:CRISPR/Cas system CSM-associated protein Csm2 small subunit